MSSHRVCDKIDMSAYQVMYGSLLTPVARRARDNGGRLRLFEIGLGCDQGYGPGASVELWRKHYQGVDLWEAEYNRKCVETSKAKGQLRHVSTVVGDQGNPSVLKQWLQEMGPGGFDAIIDDGGHQNSQIAASFEYLWPSTRPGGVYFVEDLHVGYMSHYEDTNGTNIMADVVQDWLGQLAGQPSAARAGRAEALRSLPEGTAFIACQMRACAIGRKPAGPVRGAGDWARGEAVRDEAAPPSASSAAEALTMVDEYLNGRNQAVPAPTVSMAARDESSADLPASVGSMGLPQGGKRISVIAPLTLSSGPESGLCNQIFALIGYAMVAKQDHAGLVLPNWTSHDQGGWDMPFASLYDPEAFARALGKLHIPALATVPNRSLVTGIIRPHQLHGWRMYTQKSLNGKAPIANRLITETVVVEGKTMRASSFVEDKVLLGLQPADPIQRLVRKAQATLLQNEPYGCLHPRIEIDMVRSWKVNKGGAPPKLDVLLAAMGREPEVRKMARIFVAVGVAISAKDDALLNQPTPWNAKLVRAQGAKTLHRNHGNTTQAAYTTAALVDFQICREAAWFIGWPGSTFARTLGFYHTHGHGAWFLSCGNGSMTRVHDPDKWHDHTACCSTPSCRFEGTSMQSSAEPEAVPPVASSPLAAPSGPP